MTDSLTSKPVNLLLVELQDLEIWLLNREMPNSARTVTDVIKLLMSPVPETTTEPAPSTHLLTVARDMDSWVARCSCGEWKTSVTYFGAPDALPPGQLVTDFRKWHESHLRLRGAVKTTASHTRWPGEPPHCPSCDCGMFERCEICRRMDPEHHPECPRGARDGWRPIETARNDGTHKLLWFEHLSYPVVGDSEIYAYRSGGFKATHWMPAPPPPPERTSHE